VLMLLLGYVLLILLLRMLCDTAELDCEVLLRRIFAAVRLLIELGEVCIALRLGDFMQSSGIPEDVLEIYVGRDLKIKIL